MSRQSTDQTLRFDVLLFLRRDLPRGGLEDVFELRFDGVFLSRVDRGIVPNDGTLSGSFDRRKSSSYPNPLR